MTPDRFLYLVEGLGDRLPYLKQEFPDMSEEDIVRIANSDPTEGKYVRWILSQVSQNQLRFPEDHEKVRTRLTQFDALKKKRNFNGERDINKYASYGDLAQTIDQNSEVRTKGEITREKEIEGARLLAQQGNLAVYEITTLEAGLKLGWRDTEWCVKDPRFFARYAPPYYMLSRDGKPHKLLHTSDDQLMDVYDRPTHFGGFGILGKDFIANNPKFAHFYARNIIKGRWPEGEQAIASDAYQAYLYAKDIIRGRWPEAEPTIANDPRWAYHYADRIIRGRWPEAEPAIAKNPNSAFVYAKDILKRRWPEAEPTIIKDPESAQEYAAFVIKNEWPEAEPTILQEPGSAYAYAKETIKGRWPEAEPIIAKNAKWAYHYAYNVIQGRWPEAEPVIAKDPDLAYYYALHVINGRWPEGEPAIATDPEWAYDYATDIIKGRWPEAEHNIKDSYCWDDYKDQFLS